MKRDCCFLRAARCLQRILFFSMLAAALPALAQTPTPTIQGGGSACSNGIDDDGDGKIDYVDPNSCGLGDVRTLFQQVGTNCTGGGQICNTRPAIPLNLQNASRVRFRYGAIKPTADEQCGPARVRVFIDDTEKGVTDYIGWPASSTSGSLQSPFIDLGEIPAGNHTISLQGEGKEGGCNSGTLTSWKGDALILLDAKIEQVEIAGDCPNAVGQDCNRTFSATVNAVEDSKLLMQLGQLNGTDALCSLSRVSIAVDGTPRLVSERLTWPSGPAGQMRTVVMDLGSVTKGSHTVTIEPEGETSGCNTGTIERWSGHLTFLTNPLNCTDGDPDCSGAGDNDERTDTPTPTPIVTASHTPTSTATPTGTATFTPSSTVSATPSQTRTSTPTSTVTATMTATQTATRTRTPLPENTPTETATPTITSTATATATITSTPTATATGTGTATGTATVTNTATNTVTPTATATITETATPTATITPTATSTVPVETATPQPTATPPPPQCSDGIDNDGDGTMDFPADASCTSSTDDKESDGLADIIPLVNCVTSNVDGSFTAFFGYNNKNTAPVSIAAGVVGSTEANAFSPSPENRQQPAAFAPGIHAGAFQVTFDGNDLTWIVQPKDGAPNRATASRASTACGKIAPEPQCRNAFADGTFQYRFGYVNENPFTVSAPVGVRNFFAPGTQDRGQPNSLFSGRVLDVFEVRAKDAELTWTLFGSAVKADASLPSCNDCTQTLLVNIKKTLDQTALDLSDAAKEAADRLTRITRKVCSSKERRLKAGIRERDCSIDSQRAVRKAIALQEEVRRVQYQFPEVAVSCLNSPKQCVKIDNITQIEGLKGLYLIAQEKVKRTIARGTWLSESNTKPTELIARTNSTVDQGLGALNQMPRFMEGCTK